jgi:hypothetical protein
MHSKSSDSAKILANSIVAQDNDINLVSFALPLFDIVGINQDKRGDTPDRTHAILPYANAGFPRPATGRLHVAL